MTTRVPVVSVIGDARLDDPHLVDEARTLGASLVTAGFRVVTGGLGGVMEAVSFGARHAPAWRDGMIVGILPSYRFSDANAWCDIVIPTGMQLGRNVLVVASGDVVVALGGGAGTLSEIALASQLGKPIIAFGHHGWAGRIAGTVLDGRSDARVRACMTVEAVIAVCREFAGPGPESGDIGSGFRARPSKS